MYEVLDGINTTKDLKLLNSKEKVALAKELRTYVLEVVSKNGGHLASNLGVVELTIAIHTIFNTPEDKIVWDVGHQTYIHKILTGRKDDFETLRQFQGLSGFPKAIESRYDAFDTGHSSTSISVALGMARARDIKNKDYRVVAVIGDGAMTGGMANEALNDAGSSNTNITVILNDNEMSISQNVGGVPLLLSKLRTKKFYAKSNKKIKRVLEKNRFIGKTIVRFAQKTKQLIKQLILPNMYFEDIGFTYLGPVNGHNIDELESILEKSKEIDGPVLIHVITKKGNGYKIAEDNPDKFHGISSFNIESGELIKPKKEDYSSVFGNKLVQIAEKNKKIVAITAAMKDGTGLKEFAEKYPDRFFDVGIAEQHALGMAGGMAKAGLKPVFVVYSSFLQRGYDQLIHDIALQKLPVIICIDRAGIVGNDGETHQGMFDLSFLSTIPNMNILAPKDFNELEDMLEFAVNMDSPVAIRYPRGGEGKTKFQTHEKVKLGIPEIVEEGENITIIAIGKMVETAKEVSILLKEKNISAEIINARFLKPLDYCIIKKSINKTKNCITIEDGILKGGLGATINNIIATEKIDAKILNFGYNDIFVEHGTIAELEDKYGMSAEKIYEKILQTLLK